MLIQLRPGVRQMLRRLAMHFELVLFTSSINEYANSAIDFIEGKEKYF
jgi:TFIIF-interacting CTD phosphatase-like protein